VTKDKNELRAALRAARWAAAQNNAKAMLDLLAHFRNHIVPELKARAGHVAGYAAMGQEINALPVMEIFSNHGLSLCLPVVAHEDAPLIFRAYQIGDKLQPNYMYKIPEPPTDRPVVVPDIVLVPLLGFDRAGNRIGYGKGYYDRTLAHLRAKRDQDNGRAQVAVTAIGLAYNEQEVEQITAEPHDQPLNIIVTPREVIYCPPR